MVCAYSLHVHTRTHAHTHLYTVYAHRKTTGGQGTGAILCFPCVITSYSVRMLLQEVCHYESTPNLGEAILGNEEIINIIQYRSTNEIIYLLGTY